MAKSRIQSSSTRKGRPSKCTPERIELLVGLIAGGSGREAAAREAGIGVATWHEWIGRGRAGEEPYAELVRRIEGASDNFHDKCRRVADRGVDSANEHVATTMARWFLERLWPDRYGRKQEVRTTGPDGGPLQIRAAVTEAPVISNEALRTMTPEQVDAAVSAFLRGTS